MRNRTRYVLLGSVVVIVALVAALLSVALVHSSKPSDLSLVTAGQINPAHLAAGWAVCGRNCRDRTIPLSDLHSSNCLSSYVLAPQTAGDTRNYSYKLDASTDLEYAHLVMSVRSARTASDEAAIFAATTSPAEYPCQYQQFTDYIRFRSPAVVLGAPSAEVLTEALPVSRASLIRIRQPFTKSGRAYVGVLDWLTLAVGRFRTTMDFEIVFPAPPGEPSWDVTNVDFHEGQMIQAAATALQAVAR
jgi:uncharacterized membrane protein